MGDRQRLRNGGLPEMRHHSQATILRLQEISNYGIFCAMKDMIHDVNNAV